MLVLVLHRWSATAEDSIQGNGAAAGEILSCAKKEKEEVKYQDSWSNTTYKAYQAVSCTVQQLVSE